MHFGLPGIDTTLPLLLNAGHQGLIPYERVADVYSETPARIYGLHPRKGSLKVGADADVVLIDPEQKWTVEDKDIRSKAAWSPYSGRTLSGGAVKTFLLGKLPEPGSGVFLPGPGASHRA